MGFFQKQKKEKKKKSLLLWIIFPPIEKAGLPKMDRFTLSLKIGSLMTIFTLRQLSHFAPEMDRFTLSLELAPWRLFSHTYSCSHGVCVCVCLPLSLAVDGFPDAHADAHTRSEIEILLISFQWFDAVPWSFGLVFWWVVQNELLLLLLLHFLSGDFCSWCGVFLGLLLASLLPWFWKLDRSLTRPRSGVLFWL